MKKDLLIKRLEKVSNRLLRPNYFLSNDRSLGRVKSPKYSEERVSSSLQNSIRKSIGNVKGFRGKVSSLEKKKEGEFKCVKVENGIFNEKFLKGLRLVPRNRLFEVKMRKDKMPITSKTLYCIDLEKTKKIVECRNIEIQTAFSDEEKQIA